MREPTGKDEKINSTLENYFLLFDQEKKLNREDIPGSK